MNDKELLEYMRKIDKKFNTHIKKGSIEMSLEYYNLCEELMSRGINAIQENERLKEKLEKERKIRKEAIEFMKDCEFDKTDKYIAIGEYQEYKDLLNILDIDKGE